VIIWANRDSAPPPLFLSPRGQGIGPEPKLIDKSVKCLL
jgi:hypothetical protein